jgi:phosphohistidine phosphatase
MKLYLIRHAEAVAAAANDADRELTELGREQARRLADTFQRLGVRFDAVVASPLVRAQQTAAEILALLADPKPALHTLDEIGLRVRPKRIVKFLRDLGPKSVAIVGHQPGLCNFAAWLIGSKKAQLDLEKAGFARICCDSWEKGGGVLDWLITPDWL